LKAGGAVKTSHALSDLSHQKPRKVPPRRIALSGGGIRTIAHAGALQTWRDAGILECVHEYLGVSGGAFVAMILCLGYSIDELRRLCLKYDFNMLNTFDPEQAFLFLETLGLDTGHALERLLVSILKHKGYGPHATFKELSDDLPVLRVYATNLTTSEVQEFSKRVTPDTEIVFAVRSSMSLPLYYTPMREPSTGHTFVDGGVLHNLPMAFLTEEELHDTWGIMFNQPSAELGNPSAGIVEYMKHLYNSMLHKRYEGMLRSMSHKILRIPIGHISPIHFSLTQDEKEEILQQAAEEARAFLYGPPAWIPVRRNSVS
jgi:NTE family protein